MLKRIVVAVASTLLAASCSLGDVMHLRSGGTLEGVIVDETPTRVTVKIPYGVVQLLKVDVRSIEKRDFVEPPKAAPGHASALPAWDVVFKELRRHDWSKAVEQIPATVIDKGVMRHVPYMSFRVGEDLEVNVYGDPDAPAGVEIGAYRSLVNDAVTQDRCISLVATLLRDEKAELALRRLDRAGAAAEHQDLTLEITPPTAEDAYGGWWVSAYFEKRLDSARANQAELEDITVPRETATAAEPPKQPPAPPTPRKRETPRPERRETPPPPAPSPAPTRTYDPDPIRWTPTQMSRSRAPSSGSGRVYVRGYTRKDGTYVRPHTRSRPRR